MVAEDPAKKGVDDAKFGTEAEITDALKKVEALEDAVKDVKALTKQLVAATVAAQVVVAEAKSTR